jgi:hypothetical protein
MVKYRVDPGGPIVFEADVEGFGPVVVTSRKPGIFNGRLMNRPVLLAALQLVEDFADAHEQDLAPHYAAIAAQNAA